MMVEKAQTKTPILHASKATVVDQFVNLILLNHDRQDYHQYNQDGMDLKV